MFDFHNIMESVTRKKTLESDVMETQLKRCLSLFDLTMLGAGHMIGAGIFVVAGTVTRNIAGPGIILSYIIGGFAAFLSALCYAEFGARMPKAGSAYSYTYFTIGELAAFLIGWNMLLEMIIGGASVAKAWSGSLDVLLNGAISNGTSTYVGTFGASWMSAYPDFVAMACILFWMTFIAAGAKISTFFNNILTFLNISILLLVIGFGAYYGKISNWTNEFHGGFLPYGMSGVLAGSAACFYSYAGFEGITTAGEETKNPSRNIPLAISLAVIVVSFLYIAASGALTLMVPFFNVDVSSPFSAAIQSHGCTWGAKVVGIGALLGLSCSILGSIFSIPRTAYAMAADGLLFKPLAHVNEKTQTPILSVLIFGILTSIIALVTDLAHLVELLSIGTLLCFTVVSINVILLRYQTVEMCQFQLKPDVSSVSICNQEELKDTTNLYSKSQSLDDIGKVKKQFVKFPGINKIPDGSIAPITLSLMVVFSSAIFMVIMNFNEDIMKWWVILLLTLLSLCFLVSYFLLSTHQQNTSFLTFQVPLVPFLPVLSMVINIGLMLNLNWFTWVRLAVWIVIGFGIYFGYGIRHSNENEKLLSNKIRICYSSELNTPEKDATVNIPSQSD